MATNRILALTALSCLVVASIAIPVGAQDQPNAQQHCREHPDEPRCEEMRKQAYCREHPREPRCQEEMRQHCARHPDEVRCQEMRKQAYCREHPDEPRCQEMRKEAYCREHPEEQRCREMRAQAARFHEGQPGRVHAHCAEHPEEPRCERIREAHQPCQKARRADNALTHALAAHERRLERLEAAEVRIQDELDSGELDENQTARAQEMMQRVQRAQDQTERQIAHLQEQQERLRERWQANCAPDQA